MSCQQLTAPDNGMIDCTGNVFEDTCTFSCDDNYELSGSETRTCQSDRTWSGTEAMCTLGNICIHNTDRLTHTCVHMYIVSAFKRLFRAKFLHLLSHIPQASGIYSNPIHMYIIHIHTHV